MKSLFRAREHHLRTQMVVRLPIEEVFAFFADATNLERITPKGMGFSILTPRPIAMKEGTEIRYQLKLFGLPMRWRTVIPVWQPPDEFVDVQEEGPYEQWIHRHTFEATEDGTLVGDHVRYRLPLGILGDIAYPLIRLQLNRIFAFRQKAIQACLLK